MNKYKLLILFICVFLMTRLVILFTSFDELFDSEDLATGVIAREVIKGPSLSLFDYPYITYSGGVLVDGLLAAPFFMLFGPNYFALKLVPLLFSALTSIVLFLFANRFFNRRVACITSALYIFTSTVWGRMNFYLGFHAESLLFVFVALLLFYKIIFEQKGKVVYCLMLGIISGFATYFAYDFLMTLVLMMIIWFIHHKRLHLKKELYIFVIGFLVGLVPWFIYNLECQFKGVTDVFFEFLNAEKYSSPASWRYILFGFFRRFWFPEMFEVSYLGHFFSALYAALYNILYWVSFLYIIRKLRQQKSKIIYSKEFSLLLYPFFLSIIATLYCLDANPQAQHPLGVSLKYLLSLYPFVFLTIAIAMDELFVRLSILKNIAIGIYSIVIIFAATGYVRDRHFKDAKKIFNQPGYSYLYLAESISFKYRDDFYKVLERITRLSAPERYEALILPLVIDLSGDIRYADFHEFQKLSYRLDERYRPFFYKIVIRGFYYISDLPIRDLVHQVDIISEQVDVKYKPYLYEGLGAAVVNNYPDDYPKFKEALSFIDKKYRTYYYRGLSSALYKEDIPTYLNRCRSTFDSLDDMYKPMFLEGVGEVLARFGVTTFIVGCSYDNVGLIALYDFIDNFQPQYKRYLLEAAGRVIPYFYNHHIKKDIDKFINHFKDEDRRIILKEMAAGFGHRT